MNEMEAINSQQVSDDLLQVEGGSLSPALQRMLKEGRLEAQTGTSAKGRSTRIDRLQAFVISKAKLSVSRGCLQALPVCLPQPKHRRCGLSRFSRFFSRNRRYEDISVSLQEHIDERADELMEEGMRNDEAERTARRDFGNVTLLRERSREVWQWQRLESLLVDLKHVCRRLRRSLGFAITVVLTLAIGIGANTAVFSVLNSVLLRPLPYPEPQQLVSLHINAPGAPGLAEFRSELRLSASMYFTFATHNRVFQSMGVWGPGTASITGIAQPEQVNTAQISGGVLEALNVPPFHGQWLTAADQDAHGLGRVMLSYGYWQRRFGGDPGVVGRAISVNSQSRVIAGVMPRGFKIVNYDFDLLVPLALDPVKEQLAGFAYRGIARLRPGVAISQANADLASLLNVWMDSWSNGPGSDPHWKKPWWAASERCFGWSWERSAL
jgi:hypothetical protein